MAADYYNVLGVERTATADDIKRAYRKLAHQHHPDKDGGDEEKFKEINAAYQVLSNDQKRAQYDQFGSTFEEAGAGGGPGAGFGGFNVNPEDLGDLGGIFEQFFGGRANSRSRGVRRGQDVAVDVTISFAEAAQGLIRDVTTRLAQACSRCHGNGAEPGTPIKDCATCQGSGTVNTTRQTMLGVFSQATVCPTCHGDGKQADTPCTKCRGEGRETADRTLEINIPAGIADGQTIRLTGKGEAPPRGGVAGDLYVTVHVAAVDNLVRDGDHVRTTASITFADAALGTTITVPTITGTAELAIPPGTQPGSELTLSGQGFPSLSGSGVGDEIVTVAVEVPKKLSRKQRSLLEQFKQAKPRGLFK